MNAPDIVQGAARVPLPYGLFSVVTLNDNARYSMGVEWEQLTCAPASGLAFDCDTLSDKHFASGGGVGEADPFVVYGSYRCNPIGSPMGRARDRALEHLLVREERVVERALWTGDLGNTPSLASASAQVLGSGAVDPEVAIALLEDFIAQSYGSLGVIHMTRGAAAIAIAAKAVECKGNVAYTKLGTPVIAGGGYPGTSPLGALPAAGTSWVFASPALFGYRGDPTVNESLDRGKNDMYALAERIYLLGFDTCGTAAVSMTLNNV